jgi:CheY-like chemotaxis protein
MFETHRNWRGSATELARTASALLRPLGRDEERLNERLVRYYVQSGILTRPQREGREAWFGYRQLLELAAARGLVQAGWPLAKIATWIQDADERALWDLIDTREPVSPLVAGTPGQAVFPETRRLLLAVNDDPGADLDLYAWLASRGVAVLRAYSTDQALWLLARARVQAVLSDLARVESGVLNKRAGMLLAQAIRERGSEVPLVLYTLDKSPQVKALALEAGANYVTESPDDLRDWLEKLGL